MMLDSSFWWCVRYPHWGIFPLFSEVSSCCWMIWLFLSMVIEMFDWFWLILYCTSVIHTGAYFPLHDEFMFGQRYIDGWSLLVVYLTTSTLDIILRHIPLSFTRFVWPLVWGWLISVGCLPHDFDIGSYTGAYFPIFFEHPWDWDNGQLGFRLRLVWSFRRLIISRPSYMDLSR